jgi:transposase, IS6 family
MTDQHPFKWRHFQSDIILLCVRWYLRYALSSRDLEEMMMERGLQVDHTTIYRWVQSYAPELEKRCRPHLKATNDSRAGLTRRPSRSKKCGCISTERSIPREPRSISF